MPSQSPMNGSTKYRTSDSAITAGGNHQRHARQNDGGAGAVNRCRLILLLLSATAFWFSSVFVVRLINELSFDRHFRSLNHLHAITLRIVLNFVHDVVDEEHSTTGGSEEIGGVTGIRNLTNVEAFAFVFDSKSRFFRR